MESNTNSCGSRPVLSFQNSTNLDFIILLFLAQITVRVAKHPSLGILRYEDRQHALLLAATLTRVVLLYERVFAMERDGVEIKVEGAASLQAKFLHGVEPTA